MPVHTALRVNGGQGTQELATDLDHSLHGKASHAADHGAQAVSADELHRAVIPAVLDTDVENRGKWPDV